MEIISSRKRSFSISDKMMSDQFAEENASELQQKFHKFVFTFPIIFMRVIMKKTK